MRAVSLLRAWIYGIGVFAAVTASLTVALSIAITGPPTQSEMDDLQAFLADAGRRLGVMAERAGAEACVQLPREVTGPLCPQAAAAQETAPPADEEAIVIEAYRARNEESEGATVEPVTDILAPREDDASLLGDVAGDPRPRAERLRADRPPRAQAERRRPPQRAAPQRRTAPARANVQRPARPPIAVARTEAIAPLESPAARALEDLVAATILEEEPVAEDAGYQEDEHVFEDVWPGEPAERRDAPADESIEDAFPAPWEARRQDPVYDDAREQAYEDEAYEEERERQYAEREARRRYRERMRAYREWRREGW